MITTLALTFIVGLGITVLLTPVSIRLAKYFKLIDDPKKHIHPAIIHTKPIPRSGGLPIFLAILLGSLIFLPMNPLFISILVAGALVVFIGLLDDRFDISPYIRFGMNIICAAIVVYGGLSLPFVTSPFGGIFSLTHITVGTAVFSLAGLVTICWIAWVMNMLNWSKGVDGQMPGIAAISAIVIGLASLRFSSPDPLNVYTSELAFLTAGAAIGFLIFNFYPAKIFPGYSATILGFLIGILSILSSVKLATALLVMGVPAVDAVITIIRRLLSHKSPFWHDRGHLHHLLLKAGLSQRQIAIFYWVMSLALGAISLTLSSRGKLFAIIVVVVVVSGFILTLRYLAREKENDRVRV